MKFRKGDKVAFLNGSIEQECIVEKFNDDADSWEIEDESGTYFARNEELRLLERAPRSLKELAQVALDVQDASNLSGVVHTFAEVVSEMRRLPECTGTEWCNTHPIVRAFLEKLRDLSWVASDYAFTFQDCKAIAKGEPMPSARCKHEGCSVRRINHEFSSHDFVDSK